MRDNKVTIYPKVYNTQDKPRYISLQTALERIQTGAKNLDKIEALRAGDKSQKKELPIVLFSGVFESRNDDGIIDHSTYIVTDFDHVDVEHVKALLCMDEYVYAVWVSPSGDGLKALVKISHPEAS